EGERVNGVGDTLLATESRPSKHQELRSGRIGAACLVTMRKRRVEQCLICEIELGRPVGGEAAGELLPALIDIAVNGITIASGQKLAWNFHEMLLIVRPTQTARQFQIGRDVVIRLAESRIRVERVGILAEEIVVPLPVQAC